MKIYGREKLGVNGCKSQTLIVKVLVGDGTFEDDNGKEREIKIAHTMNYSPVIMFDDGEEVVFSWNELINMAYNFKKEQENKEEK